MDQPWGRSVSVNKVEWASGLGDAIQTLRIAMPSGDVITVDAAAFRLSEPSTAVAPPLPKS